MKKRIHYRIAVPLVAVIVLPAVARAQEADVLDFGEQEIPGVFIEVGGNENTIRQKEIDLRREIEAIETASARRRAELEQRLGEVARQRERLSRQATSSKPAMNSGIPSLVSAQPRWLIGVQVAPSSSSGVAVQQVLPDTPAARAGIQNGDKIEAVNGITVGGVSALNAIINAAGNQELSLRVLRGDHRKDTKIRPTQQQPQRQAPQLDAVPGLDAFGGGGATGGSRGLFGSRPFDSHQLTPAPKSGEQQWLEVRPRRTGILGNRGGPDTGEIQSLKGEIRELREIVQQLAATLSTDVAEVVEVEVTDDEAGDDDEGGDADLGSALEDLQKAVGELNEEQN